MQKIVVWISVLGLLAGCQHTKVAKKHRTEHVQESIARLSDIPDAPLHTSVRKVVKSKQIPDNLQVFYNLQATSREVVKKFYKEEMERFGWQLYFEFDGEHDCVEFIKPNGMICLIIFKNREFVITLIRKKEMS